MRTIKFKGQIVDSKKWIYGSLINNAFFKRETNEACCYILDNQIMEFDCFEDIGEQLDYYEVIPETVGQFTGLKDKNGTDIYEGDLIQGGKLGEKCIVEFDDHCGRFIARSDKYQILGHKFKMFEIIGNIHDKK